MKQLNKSVLNLYGIPSLGFQFWVSLEIFFFAVFLSDYALLPVALMGTVMFITGLFDVVWVPTSGIILERVDMKWGKFRSWMLVGPPIALIFFLLQFAKIGTPTINAILVTIGFVVSHLVWNLFYAGHLALNSSMTQVREERVSMASNRGMFNALGAILFSLFISQGLGEATNASQFTMFAFWGGLIMIAGYYLLFVLTKDYAYYGKAKENLQAEKMPIADMIKQIFVNPPLLGMLLGDLGRYLSRFIIFGMAVYFIRDVKASPAIIGVFFTGLSIAYFAGAAIAGPIAKKIGERITYVVSLVIFIIGLLVVYLVPLNQTAFLVVMYITYLGYGMPEGVFVAMYSNAVEYGEWKTGKNARGFIMSLISFPLKLGILGSRVVIAVVLGIGGYVANTDPSPALISALKAGFTLVPALFLAISVICILFLYRITPDSLKKMQEEIAARK